MTEYFKWIKGWLMRNIKRLHNQNRTGRNLMMRTLYSLESKSIASQQMRCMPAALCVPLLVHRKPGFVVLHSSALKLAGCQVQECAANRVFSARRRSFIGCYSEIRKEVEWTDCHVGQEYGREMISHNICVQTELIFASIFNNWESGGADHGIKSVVI